MRREIYVALALCTILLAPAHPADNITLARPFPSSMNGVAAAMPGIARDAETRYRDPNRERYLDNLFRLQLVAGEYAKADRTLAAWETVRRAEGGSALLNLKWTIYTRARLLQRSERIAFDQAFRQAADGALPRLNAFDAYKAIYALETPPFVLDGALNASVKKAIGRMALALPDALDLVRNYLAATAAHQFFPLMKSIAATDDRRRYIIEDNVPVKAPNGATVCAVIVRPRAPARLTALLDFSIYADFPAKRDEARITAAHGYAGVLGFTRGKLCSPDAIVPVEHDGADADALIGWIAAQPWSDGRVGMYGGSYDGFTQWAALKHPPKALKAIMPLVTFSPGTDFPMEGNIALGEAYTWPVYTTTNRAVNDALYNDDAHWNRLFRNWYTSGRAWRDLARIDGRPNPFFERWLDHPSFDRYWQSTIPVGREFARIGIPVLTMTGYYDSGQVGALSYFLQHTLEKPDAEHYLVIGPWDHHSTQIGTIGPMGNSIRQTLRGYTLDPVAQIDTYGLRYAWFDYVFRGAQKPTLLADKVDYEVMGANVWKHAPSLAAMAGSKRRFYFGSAQTNAGYRLADSGNAKASVVQTLDLTDRSDTSRFAPAGKFIDQSADDWPIVGSAPNLAHGLVFETAALDRPPEVSGLFSAHLDFITNKRDFDIAVTLFEHTAKGEYVQLSYVWKRASYVADRSARHLLAPGRRTKLDITAGRLTSRQFGKGSRLVAVLSIVKLPDEQIDYGSGKPVSDETIADAGAPLEIRWFGDSYVDVPFRN